MDLPPCAEHVLKALDEDCNGFVSMSELVALSKADAGNSAPICAMRVDLAGCCECNEELEGKLP